MSSTVDGLAAEYLRRLETALKGLPTARRTQLVAEIAEHLNEARAELAPDDEVGLRDLLDRIGRPEDIAAETVAGRAGTRGWGRGRIALVGAGAAVLVAALVTALVVGRPGPPTTTVAKVPVPVPVPSSISVSHPVPVTPVTSAVAPMTTRPRAPVVEAVTASKPPIPAGIYVNGVQGTPHYFVSVTNGSGGTVSGDVDFLFQDGQTEVAFTFTGTLRNGLMTIYPANVQHDPRITGKVPPVLSAAVDHDAFGLGECTGYLPGTESLAECEFTFSPEGMSGPSGNN